MTTLEKVLKVMSDYKYLVFDKNPYDINLVGLRGEFIPDKFNCQLLVFYLNEEKQMQYHLFPFTTYPGVYWIDNPMQPAGCAVISEGQHRSVWQLGYHYSIEALVNIDPAHPMRYFRIPKGTRDLTGYELKKTEAGAVGLNLHPVMDHNPNTVGQDSAGCQVAQYRVDFDFLISICKKQVAAGLGPRFTYTIINQQSL